MKTTHSVPSHIITTIALISLLALGLTGCAATADHAATGQDTMDAVESNSFAGAPLLGSNGVRSLALRVHHADAMAAFYSEAFGVTFRTVETFGIESRFGDLGGLTLKLVPIRQSADFVGFPDAQIGFEVDDIQRVVDIAEKHGGRLEGEIRSEGDAMHGAVRDPDGNTIELYAKR